MTVLAHENKKTGAVHFLSSTDNVVSFACEAKAFTSPAAAQAKAKLAARTGRGIWTPMALAAAVALDEAIFAAEAEIDRAELEAC